MLAVEPARRTLPALLELAAERWAERPLLRSGDVTRSYAEMRDAVAAQAGALAAAGIRPGDRLAAVAGNRVELMDAWLACGWLGATLVPLDPALRGAQLAHALELAAPSALAVDLDTLRHVEAAGVRLPDRVWVFAETFPAAGRPVAREAVHPGDTVAVLFTSGTTGPAKGVVCPHAQFYWWGVNTARSLGVREGDVLYTCLPLFHTNALNTFVQALLSGATYALGSRFSASRFWGEAAAAGATVTYLLGAMVSMLYRRPSDEDRAHRVRVALAPAAPPALHEPFRERFGVKLVEAYGSTETNYVIGSLPDDVRPGLMGRVLEGFEARVVDEDDGEVADGETGELVLRHHEPYAFAAGYLGDAEATVRAWRNLWFHTGDRVVRDPDGWFRFVDRAKDAIRRRGENISSWEVEQALLTHPDVEAAAVVGVPSDLGEEEVLAFVVPRNAAELEPLQLLRHLEGRIAYFAVPRYVELVGELPLTENGKVRKAALRERGVRAGTWDRESVGWTPARA